MDPFNNISSYWDLVQQPSGFSTIGDDDFLALLQKQFPTTVGNSPKPFEQPPPDGVDPQSISTFPLPNQSPSSSDSSPSPPSANDNSPSSRPQSGVFSPSEQQTDDPSLKRKASDEDMDAEPSSKNAHTNGSMRKSISSSSRRKSTGNPQQDEFRLLKRKEQNRAAQRAFRERKEKHVKDLEDKVAALEAKNQAAESENENLRDLLSRLQSENMALKQAQFTFSMPKNGQVHAPPSYNSPTPNANDQFHFQGAGPSSNKPTPNGQSPVPPPFDFNFGSMIPFDPAVLNVLDDSSQPQHPAANDSQMNMDFSFPAVQPRMLASNPTYMSFGEPMALDQTSPSNGATPQTSMDSMGMATFGDWSPPTESGLSPQSIDSFDQLFGGNYMSAQSPVDFSALLRSPPSAISPVQHALRPNGSVSSSLTPNSSSESSNTNTTSPSSASSSTTPSMTNVGSPNGHNLTECPRTKEQMAAVIRNAGTSTFVDSPPPPPALLRKTCDTDSGNTMIMCQGSSFPKTEKSDKNIEVLTAWRSITSNPHFKDVDINDLCTEFTAKARCDGTKVVLEPEGVTHIIETLSAKRKQQEQQKQQGAQQSQ